MLFQSIITLVSPPVSPPLHRQKAEEDVFASSFGRRQDVGKSLLHTHSPPARFRWWDAKSAKSQTQRRPIPGLRPRHGPQPDRPRYRAHAWNRPGRRPKSHCPLRYLTGSKPAPGTYGSWRDAQAAQHGYRYRRYLTYNAHPARTGTAVWCALRRRRPLYRPGGY